MAHVCVLETNAAGFIAPNMRCETRAHCLTALPLAIILVFYFRYALVSAVWNAVRIRCTNLTYCSLVFVCPEARGCG